MAWEFSLLVVANVTASSDELLDALRERAREGACRFTLVMPASGAEARLRLEDALARMREAGLEKVEGSVGDPDPVVAVMDVWDPMKFDEIVVSTLPTGSSRWLGLDLPHRLEKLTSVPVRHVVSRPPVAEVPTGPPPEHPERYGVLSPLAAAFRPRSP
jgi:hypothetical protein